MTPSYFHNIIVLVACLSFAGCKPTPPAKQISKFKPLQNGFGVVAKWIGVDSGPSAALYYKGTNESPVLVWRDIGTHGYPILYTNDIALLLADKPDQRGYFCDALVLVQGAGPAMDISHDVLRVYTLQTNANFSTLLKNYSPLRLKQADGRIFLTYAALLESRLPPGLEFSMTWEEIFSIMEDVKRTGRTNKITNTDLLYLQKSYGELTK